ncbi:HEAT repeat domain-containing protein [Gemmatimonadota bacterium Y43]|uniref:HEAT repeat domain-containing protein n=1 Tax=Gaopeijia maritima TaxID=3119007 RepID=UPI00326FCA61
MSPDSDSEETIPAPGLAAGVDDLFRRTESPPEGVERGDTTGLEAAPGSEEAKGETVGAAPAVDPLAALGYDLGFEAGAGEGGGGARRSEVEVGGPPPVRGAEGTSEGVEAESTGPGGPEFAEAVEADYEIAPADPGGAVASADFGAILSGVVRERVDLPASVDSAPPMGVSDDDLRRALAAFMASEAADRPASAMRVRFQAEKLGGAGEHEGVALAVERMLVSRPDDEGVRELACQLVTDEVARVLTFRLVDRARDEDEGRALARAFGRLNMEMADAVSHTLARTEDRIARRVLTEVLVRLAPEAQEIMADFIQDARWTVVRDAVTVIGRTGIPNAVQFLTTALAHEEPRVRAEALRALGAVGGGEAAVLARSYLDVADAEVRNAAAEAVGALRDPGSVPRLLARLDDESEREGLVALLHALGRIGDVAAYPALEKRAAPGRLGRGPTEVRVAAVRALAALDTADGWAAVEALVDDRDDEVRGLVRFLLRSR